MYPKKPYIIICVLLALVSGLGSGFIFYSIGKTKPIHLIIEVDQEYIIKQEKLESEVAGLRSDIRAKNKLIVEIMHLEGLRLQKEREQDEWIAKFTAIMGAVSKNVKKMTKSEGCGIDQ